MHKDYNSYFNQFKNYKVVIVGDVMTDSYLIGKVNRISPEAPVPIVELQQKESRLGGAANVALNVAALGAQSILCSVVGNDLEGNNFIERSKSQKISCEGIVQSESRQTTVKTRIIAQNQQLIRIDEEDVKPLTSDEEKKIIEKFNSIIHNQKIDAVIFEDYNKGVLTSHVIQSIIELCNKQNIITTVDPKKTNFLSYKNVTLFKPNLKELREGIDPNIKWGDDNFLKAIEHLEQELNNKITLVTLSEKGVFIKKGEEHKHISAHIRNISDVSGAGDTVISTATLCLIAGLSLEEIASISNLAGGIVCESIGVVPIDYQKLVIETNKIIGSNATK